jgi:hypothetical protein
MAKYETRQELANKIDWEGGIFDMIFGYGLYLDDLPEGDKELLAALSNLKILQPGFEAAVARLEKLLPEPGDSDG